MKKILLFASILIIGLNVNSQTLEMFTFENVKLNNGDTVYSEGLPSATEIIGEVKVLNISGADKSVICEKEEISIVPGTENTFCWGSCFPPTTFVSPNPIILVSGDTSSGFSGHYAPKNIIGTSVIRYVFRILHGDTICVFIKFNALYNSIANNNFNSNISAPFPNPANNNVSINYNISNKSNASIKIHNVYGKLEKQLSLLDTKGVINFDVSDLPSGIYFYSLSLDGKIVKTNKLIIVH